MKHIGLTSKLVTVITACFLLVPNLFPLQAQTTPNFTVESKDIPDVINNEASIDFNINLNTSQTGTYNISFQVYNLLHEQIVVRDFTNQLLTSNESENFSWTWQPQPEHYGQSYYLVVAAFSTSWELYSWNNNAHYFYLRNDSSPVASFNIDSNNIDNPVNPFWWGINAPLKRVNGSWTTSDLYKQRIEEAGIKLIRVGPVQSVKYGFGHDICSSNGNCDFTDMDKVLNAIFTAGAEPLFLVNGYPGGIAEHDWQAYAEFMKTVVTRYNINNQLGHKIKYWEMWNEPVIEPDGKITSQAEYANFVNTVGTAMKQIDPTIKLLGPAKFSFDKADNNSWLEFVEQDLGIIDILSWHDYLDSEPLSDQMLIQLAKDFYSLRPNQIDRPKAITEYNMDAGTPEDLNLRAKFNNEYGAIFTLSSIINAANSNVNLFTFFNIHSTGENAGGILDNNPELTRRKTYYAFQLMSRYTGDNLLPVSGSSDFVEVLSSIDEDFIYLIMINKNVKDPYTISIDLNNDSLNSSYEKVSLNAESTNLESISYSNLVKGKLSQTLSPISAVGIKIPRNGLPSGECKGDYNSNGIVDIQDFSIFASNYNKENLQCDLDLVGNNCWLDINDLSVFVSNYKTNVCSFIPSSTN